MISIPKLYKILHAVHKVWQINSQYNLVNHVSIIPENASQNVS